MSITYVYPVCHSKRFFSSVTKIYWYIVTVFIRNWLFILFYWICYMNPYAYFSSRLCTCLHHQGRKHSTWVSMVGGHTLLSPCCLLICLPPPPSSHSPAPSSPRLFPWHVRSPEVRRSKFGRDVHLVVSLTFTCSFSYTFMDRSDM